jgi:diacylglycerol kinase family enzyme
VRNAALIVNPVSGRASLLRRRLPAIEAEFRKRKLRLQILYTTPEADSAAKLAQSVVGQAAMIIACGGDGTVHGVLQAIVHTQTALGVLPLGTANALARHLKVPLDPLCAVDCLLKASPTRVAVGSVASLTSSRFFLVMAGCGPDGALVRSLSGDAALRAKRRFGRASYYAQAGRLFLTRGWPGFQLEYRTGDQWHTTAACAVLASRLPDLGGLFHGLTRRADFHAPTLHLQIIRPPAHLALAAWFTLSRMGVRHPLHRSVDVDEFRCTAGAGNPTYAQADAELLGPLPLSARVLPGALTLLVPNA